MGEDDDHDQDLGRNRQGRFVGEHTDADVLAAVDEHEPAATSEVGAELGIARQSADYRLRKLADDGRVRKKKIGASLVWFLDEDPPATEDIASSGSSPAREPPGGVDGSGGGGRDQPGQEPRDPEATAGRDPRVTDAGDAVPCEVGELDLPGSGETLRRRRKAAGACYLYLRDQGTAQKSDFVREVYETGHQAGYQSSGGWWNAVGDGLRDLAEQRDEVIAPGGEGEHTWTYAGEGDR